MLTICDWAGANPAQRRFVELKKILEAGHIMKCEKNIKKFKLVLNFLSRKKKFYSLNSHVLDIKHLFQCNRLLYYLKECFLPNTWTGQQSQYLKHVGDNPVANWKMTLGQVVTNFTGQVVCVCVCARAYVYVCYNIIVLYTIHHWKLCTCMFILKENFWSFS